jgi:polysaccharide deacetylase 2 family uncharacterized protein YibQ
LGKSRSRSINRRKKPSGKRPLITLLVVVILIALAFILLETLKRSAPVKPTEQPTEQPVPVERHKMPARPGEPTIVQQPYTTAIKPLPPKHPRKREAGPGSVAIIVDDMGSSLQEVNELMAIKLPLTFSIIPGLAKGKEVAQAAHANGYLVMIHIPMEPQGYPQQHMEKNGLLLSQSDAEIQRRLSSFMQGVPFAAGANNHMGSRFTEDKAKMGTVLGLLKGKGLFFIDSKTTPHSVGYSLAREMGIETASRNVFIDNVQDVDAIKEQLEQLAEMARRKGAAIGICHPHKTTIIALTALLPELHRSGINFVYARDLVR